MASANVSTMSGKLCGASAGLCSSFVAAPLATPLATLDNIIFTIENANDWKNGRRMKRDRVQS